MKKNIYIIVVFTFLSFTSYSQLNITNTQTPAQLVQNVLLGTGVTVSNISFNGSTANANLLRDQVGRFLNGATTNIGIDNGVILTTGKTSIAIGPNNNPYAFLATSNPVFGDPDLSLLNPEPINNKAVLEFDFVPVGQDLSFNFVFASEEYPDFVNTSYNDVFGFFLSGPGIAGPFSNGAINIALIPGTTVPITINNLNNGNTNTGPCEYCAYYVNNGTGFTPALNPTIQYNGFTTVIAAKATVQCGLTYHIKLAIANVGPFNDNENDSAVFLQANSFTTTPINFPNDYLVSNGFAPCFGGKVNVCSGLAATVPHVWTLNGSPIPGEVTSCLDVTQPGIYCATAYPFGPACPVSDCLTVEFQASLPISQPLPLTKCTSLFNLTVNTATILNGLTGYSVLYHNSLINAQNLAFPIASPSSYTGFEGEVIYVSVEDNNPGSGGCIQTASFILHVDPAPCIINPVTPPNLFECDTSFGIPSDDALFDFTPQTLIALGTNSAANYTISYHLSQADANNDVFPINPINYSNVSNPETIFIRMEEIANPATFGTTFFQLIVNPNPTATISGPSPICFGDTALITINGTPGADVTYSVNGPLPLQTIMLDGTGTKVIATLPLTAFTNYQLGSVTNPLTTCSSSLIGFLGVNVIPKPTATILGTTAVCKNAANPLITFTGANGTAPYTFIYKINNGANQSITTTVGNSVTVSAPTTVAGLFTYDLVSVSSATTPVCSQIQIGAAIVTINDIPTATISGAAAVCLNDPNVLITFTGANGIAPYTFTYKLNGGANQAITTISGNSITLAVPTAVATTFTYDLVSVRDSSPASCSQAQTGTAIVTINTAPIINNPTPYAVCDDNNDGTSCLFNLTTKDNQITGGNSNIVVTYHETITDSQTGANPLVSPYCNINNSGLQTLYVRTYNIGSTACYTNTTLQLIVNPIPIPNPIITDYQLCDDNLVPGTGFELFNLSTKSAEIANGQLGVTVTYYSNQPDAIAQTNALPNLYTNTSNPQQIWINIRNNVTGCNSVSSFNLVVNPLPTVVAPTPMFECSNGASNQAQFDLSLNNGTITNGVPGITVSYYNTLTNAQNETAAISSTNYLGTDNEIVFVRVENNATGCYDTTILLLRVTQGPIAITPQPQQYCDPNNDGFVVFNLEDSTNEIAGGILPPGVTVTYHETVTDANNGANALVSPYTNINPWTQTLYVRVFYTLTGCSNYVQLQLNVNPTPEATTPLDYHTCDDNYDGLANFDLTTRVNEVLGAINPATHSVTFYTSLANAQSGSNAIVNLANYPNATINTQTLWIRVETILTGCFDIVTLELVVDPLPNATQPNYPQYSLCDTTAPIGFEVFNLGSKINAISLGQTGMNVTFHLSQADANADTNALPLLYQNVPIYVQTLWIRIENASTGCYAVSTMDIRVEPLPTPIPPSQAYTLCDENQDGLTDFDLTTLTTGILQGANYVITYHETLIDAQSGNNALVSPYQSITPFVQFIYVRAVDPITGCSTVMVIELNVDPSPVMPTTLPDLTTCDQDNNTQNGLTVFNLTQETALILAAQSSPAVNYTVTYHVSLSDAQAGIPIVTPASYTNTTAGQIIWARIENNSTGCFSIGTFKLLVNAPLLLSTPAPLSICDNDTNPNDLFTTFNLRLKDIAITQGLPGYTVTYYPSFPITPTSVAIATPTAYINTIPAVQTLGVMVTSAQGCKSYTTLDIRVLPIPVPRTNPPALAAKCDDNNPGDLLEVFDLTANAAYIINGDPNVTLHYFATQTDADTNQNEIIPANTALVGQNVWIRVENNRVDYQGDNCYVLVEQPLRVNPLPIVVQAPTLLPFYSCDNDADGISTFDLQDQISNLLGATQSVTDYAVSFYATALGANPSTNTGEPALPLTNYQNIIPFQEDVYVRVENNTTGCVNATGILKLIVEQAAVANPVTLFSSCDTYANQHDGIYQLDLTTFNATVLGAQNPAVFLITYYHTQAAANAAVLGTEITNATTYETAADDDTVWIRVTNTSTTSLCYALTPLVIHIERYPDPSIVTQNNVNTICVNYLNDGVIRNLLLEANNPVAGSYTYQWFENGATITGATNPTYLVNTTATAGATRTYTVEMTSVALNCATLSPAFDVLQSGPAVIPINTFGYTVTNAFEQNQMITVNIEGYGTYQYSLDEGPRQDSNVFENVTLGTHTITVWDSEGGLIYSCDSLIIENVQIIDYPHYFTPNGDGIHDTWNIVGLGGQPSAKIYIFDRYGKLLKQISSTGAGWDGTYNGKLLPSTDYWFTVDFAEGLAYKQFKAHFSLKR